MPDELEALWKELRSLRARAAHLEAVGYTGQPVRVRVYRDIGLTVPHSSYTAVPFTHQRWDDPDDDQWAIGEPTKLVCRIAGTYLISANFRWQHNAVGSRGGVVQLNAATNILQILEAPAPDLMSVQSMGIPYKLAVNDFLVLHVLQTCGNDLLLESSAQVSPEFSMARIP